VSPSPGHGTGTRFRRNVGGGPDAAGRARRELGQLQAELDGPVLDSVRLLVTELVTNAIRHARAPTVELSVDMGTESVRVEVANAGGDFPATPRSDQDSGWGLFLVDRLSDRWGLNDEPGRQRVWFELARV
jgi:anti-sigma regulatory factor (Ser/Thr protein kinase)